MKEEFVPPELSKKLKEKDYPQSSFHYYAEDGGICIPVYNFENEDMPEVAVPQIHEVLKWLREEKKIHIIIDISESGWFFNIRCLRTGYVIDGSLLGYSDSYEESAISCIDYIVDDLI